MANNDFKHIEKGIPTTVSTPPPPRREERSLPDTVKTPPPPSKGSESGKK